MADETALALPGGVEIDRLGLSIPENITPEDWAEVGKTLRTIDGSLQWWIGDWWLKHKPEWGDGRAVCDAAELNYGSVRVAASVSKDFPLLRRRNNLPWCHHAEVSPLSEEEQDEILDQAEDQGWSKKRVRTAVQERKRLNDIGEIDPSTIPNTIDLRCCSVLDLLNSLSGPVGLVHADPPWSYENDGAGVEGLAADEYETSDMDPIVEAVDRAYDLAADDCYLVLWTTFPKLEEWILASSNMRWKFLSGGAWDKAVESATGKTKLGVGYHWRGDSEPVLLYKKGKPRALETISNVWAAARQGHSEKPQLALRDFVKAFCRAGLPVLDLYAGASGSLARACKAEGASYVGAEMDPGRHREALARISQGDLFGGV